MLFFKALLFICRGKVIHILSSTQDLRYGGGLVLRAPLTAVRINIANLALCGAPFLAGFYSKDLLIESTLILDSRAGRVRALCLMVGLSARYSTRFGYLRLVRHRRQPSLRVAEETRNLEIFSKIVLLAGAAVSGSIYSCLLFASLEIITLPRPFKWVVLGSTVVGVILGIFSVRYHRNRVLRQVVWRVPLSGLFLIWELPKLRGGVLSKLTSLKRHLAKGLEYG